MARSRRFIGLVAGVALAMTAALVLAACGTKTPSAADILNKTFAADQNVKSGKMQVDVSFTGQNIPKLSGPATFKMGGPFQSQGEGKLPNFDITLSVSAQGQNLGGQLIVAGGKAWIVISDSNPQLKPIAGAYEIPENLVSMLQTMVQQAQAQGSTTPMSLKSLGINPDQWISNAKVTETDIGGTAVYEVTGGVDIAKFATDFGQLVQKVQQLNPQAAGQVDQAQIDKMKADLPKAVKSASVTVASGKDDSILRKFDVKATVASPDNPQQTADIAFTLTLSDINQPQNIQGPANAKPLDELLKKFGVDSSMLGGLGALGGMGGGAMGGSGSTTPAMPGMGGTTGSSGSSGASGEFVKCVQEAERSAGSTAEQEKALAKCQALLTGK